MNKDSWTIAILTRNQLSWRWLKLNIRRSMMRRKILNRVRIIIILTSIWHKEKNIFTMLSRNMSLKEKLNTEPFKVKWWEPWAWTLSNRRIHNHLIVSENTWTIATSKCKNLFKISMKIESCINLPLTRRKRSKLTPSELSRKKLLILLTWWTKCPVFWFKTTKTLTNLEPWSMTLDTSFTGKMKKEKMIKKTCMQAESVKMRKSMEPCQTSTHLEDHHSTRSRLFKSNSTLLFLTLVTITWKSAPNLPKRLTIWRSVWFQKMNRMKMLMILKSKKHLTRITLEQVPETGSIEIWFSNCYLKY